MQNIAYSGTFAIVVFPDTMTSEKARRIAQSVTPTPDRILEVEELNIPLFTAVLKSVPLHLVAYVVNAANGILCGKQIHFKELCRDNDGWLSWIVKPSNELTISHLASMLLKDYINPMFLDFMRKQLDDGSVVAESLQQRECVLRYGTPYTMEHFHPSMLLSKMAVESDLPVVPTDQIPNHAMRVAFVSTEGLVPKVIYDGVRAHQRV
jgi:hypothetical protein